jgi:NTE family protein
LTYRYIDTSGTPVLNVYPHEKERNEIKIGIHYDDYFKAGVYLNASYRNLFKKASILTIESRISDNLQASIQYFLENGRWLSHYLKLETNNFKAYLYSDGVKISSYQYSDLITHLGFQSTLSNSIAWGLGIYGELSSIRNSINPLTFKDITDRLVGAYMMFKVDNYDRTYFPTRGAQLLFNAQALTDINSKSKEFSDSKPILVANLRYNNAIPISSKLSAVTRLYGSIAYGDSVPISYYCYLGGMSRTSMKGIMPFAGLDMMEKFGQYGWLGRLDLQYEWTRNNFITLIGNIGMTSNVLNDFYHFDNYIIGGGLSYGYKSLIGPIEFSLLTASKKDLSTYFNIGLWF